MTGEIGRYTFADVEVRAAVALPELLPVPADAAEQPDVVTVLWRAWTAQPVEWFHWWGAPESPWARFGDTASGYVIEFPEVATFRVSRDGTVIEVHPAPAVPAFTVRHVLLNQVLPLALTRVGRVVLHALAVHGMNRGKAKQEVLKGAALAGHEGKRARKGHKVHEFKDVQRVMAA